ncbi:tRNA (adenosine(37)-N6)-dimethylallyltransferase MiaA [Candidatus Dependentiae bacterium]|nr:tRNA (adenosine(37)-N6)-dimethylallyltransferase MiaA [Candidatus Dependentiae bacterium]
MNYPLIFILGPTGIGKTELVIELAFQINAEIISADSMQIYKYMEIGTSSPTETELRGINYHLINFILPDRRFTAGDFKRLGDRWIEKIKKKNKKIIISGGTGLYFDTLIKGLPPKKTEDFKYRDELIDLEKEKGKLHLFNMLIDLDPEYAQKIHMNDLQRVIRALEVIHTTGKRFSEFQNSSTDYKTKYPYILFALNSQREILYERINNRTEKMFKNHWIDEVKKIIELGYEENLNSMKALGYYELFKYLKNEIPLDRVKEIIAQRTRNYAKRQLTWIRKYKDEVNWIDRSFNVQEDVSSIIKILKNSM